MKKTWLYLLCGAILAGLMASCGGLNSILRSGNPELIYKKGLELYKAEKWSRATAFFDGIQHIYDGSSREDSLAFFSARCKFKTNDYQAAGELFDQFRKKYGRSVFIEDAEGMYALCFYYMSPSATRDQTMTAQARIAINEFVSRYPTSERLTNFRTIDKELLQRLHDKAFTNAYTYYKIGRYKSAIVALKNALRDYPNSEHREELMYLIVDSSYRLASNSVASKQIDRYLLMLDSYYTFVEEYPTSERIKGLERMAQNAKDFLDKNNKENK